MSMVVDDVEMDDDQDSPDDTLAIAEEPMDVSMSSSDTQVEKDSQSTDQVDLSK